jgi:hypothetical protein
MVLTPTMLTEATAAPDTILAAGRTMQLGLPSERKLRLYACACCRRVWDKLAPACRRAVEAAEQFADGWAGPDELADAERACRRLEGLRRLVPTEESEEAFLAGRTTELRYCQLTEQVHRIAAPAFTLADACNMVEDLRPWRGQCLDNEAADAAHARIADDLFGGPFPQPPFDRAWRTPAVLSLAWAMYRELDFGRMPALADALAAAGCDDTALLDHCRGGGEHVRGCWASDAALGLG